ncbi:MAG TPA: hypothetical protein VGF99_17355 [Myxococcota bacterium]
MRGQRLFLEVQSPQTVIAELGDNLFVPTRVPWQLGDLVELGLRLPRVSRSLDIPVVVVGRRLPRPGSMLSAGVVVRAFNPNHPVLEILRDVVAGTVVDLEARLQERLRLPASTEFRSVHEARVELAGLLEDDGVALALDAPAIRGDRLNLDVVVDGDGVCSLHVLVKRIQIDNGSTRAVCVALDDTARATLVRFLTTVDKLRQTN